MEISKIRYKEEIEEAYASILADYAVKRPREHSREYEEHDEEDDDNRSSFQRDRDRIIHTKAFRRLMYKTQVFVNHEGDHFRTRLTHTMEVAQFARGICKSLALNEDLAEAIALGHDLGHTPFGHAVETFLSREMDGLGLGRFYHNEQSVRVVDFLEMRTSGGTPGLNLTWEVREGILKHNYDRSGIYAALEPELPCSTIEGQIVGMVDTIAYICHDLEDAIGAGIVWQAMKKNEDFKTDFMNIRGIIREQTGIQIEYDAAETFFIRRLIHYFITKLTESTFAAIQANKIRTLEDVGTLAGQKKCLVGFDAADADFFRILKGFVYQRIYDSQTVSIMDTKAVEVVRGLFEAFKKQPKLLPPEWLYRYEHAKTPARYQGAENSAMRVICDYISCLTDRSALEEHEKLFNPGIKI